jgi:hypothetical protein
METGGTSESVERSRRLSAASPDPMDTDPRVLDTDIYERKRIHPSPERRMGVTAALSSIDWCSLLGSCDSSLLLLHFSNYKTRFFTLELFQN